MRDPETIAALARKVPGLLNVFSGPGVPPVPELQKLGVRRESLGSGPARAATGQVQKTGHEPRRSGAYSETHRLALSYPEANALFEK